VSARPRRRGAKTPPWWGEGRATWVFEATAWADAAARAAGWGPVASLDLFRDEGWSWVARAETQSGRLYFKALADYARHEPSLVAELARRFPDCVPAPIAIDPERGFMLVADHGSTMREALREASDADRLSASVEWLPRYAEMQIETSREPARWLALRVPDRRLSRMAALVEALLKDDAAILLGAEAGLGEDEREAMRSLLPELSARAGELAAAAPNDAIEHGDLHDANVLVGCHERPGPWIFDWADAALSHPFFTMVVTARAAIEDVASGPGRRRLERLRDAYLEPWTALAPASELREAFALAWWLGYPARALCWAEALRTATPAAHTGWGHRVPTWLRLWRAREESWLG